MVSQQQQRFHSPTKSVKNQAPLLFRAVKHAPSLKQVAEGDFLKQPLQWDTAAQARISENKAPLPLRKRIKWPLALHPMLAGAAAVALLLLVLVGLGVQSIKTLQPETIPLSSDNALLGMNTPPFQKAEPGVLANALMAVSSESKVSLARSSERLDPFRPLVQTDWMTRQKQLKENELNQKQQGEPDHSSHEFDHQPGFQRKTSNEPVMPFPAQPETPAINFNTNPLRFVGYIRESKTSSTRMVLLQYKGQEGSRLITKPVGSLFELDGMSILIKSATSSGVKLMVNGVAYELNATNALNETLGSPSTSLTPPKVSGRVASRSGDAEIDKILSQLDLL